MSPRDLEPDQLSTFTESFKEKNGAVLLDPQFYLPRADHARLQQHKFWPKNYDTGSFWAGPGLQEQLKTLYEQNLQLKCAEFILPGILAEPIDQGWLDRQAAIFDIATSLNSNYPSLGTIALSADSVQDDSQVELLLETAAKWKHRGYYLVFQSPAPGFCWTPDKRVDSRSKEVST